MGEKRSAACDGPSRAATSNGTTILVRTDVLVDACVHASEHRKEAALRQQTAVAARQDGAASASCEVRSYRSRLQRPPLIAVEGFKSRKYDQVPIEDVDVGLVVQCASLRLF